MFIGEKHYFSEFFCMKGSGGGAHLLERGAY